MTDLRELDLRPMVWDVAMVAPAPDADATVMLRVTYRSLVDIIDDLGAVSRSAIERADRNH